MSGAPSPPAAMSAARRFESTGAPTRSAIHAGSPSCRVPRACPPSTQWKSVWPCDTTRSGTTPVAAMPPAAASANAWPSFVSSSQKPPAVSGSPADTARMRSRPSADHATVSACSTRRPTAGRSSASSAATSTTATSMPSAEVPDCRESTIMPTPRAACPRRARRSAASAARRLAARVCTAARGSEPPATPTLTTIADGRTAASCSIASRCALCAPTASTSTTNGSRESVVSAASATRRRRPATGAPVVGKRTTEPPAASASAT